MPELIITTDKSGTQAVWDASHPPEYRGEYFCSNGKSASGLWMGSNIPYPTLPSGHMARLVLADVQDCRPVPEIEWHQHGPTHICAIGDHSAQFSPARFGGMFCRIVGRRGCSESCVLVGEAEARAWCEAELRKAVAK